MVRYIAGPEMWPDEQPGQYALRRRGMSYGWVIELERPTMPEMAEIYRAWHADEAVMLPGFLSTNVERHTGDIAQARQLMENILDEKEMVDLLEAEPYASRLAGKFIIVASVHDDGDPQEIDKLFFDAEKEGKIIGQDLWCKASWLSYFADDASLRFRFSFGLEGFEDVASDLVRQQQAAQLTDLIFPESGILAECPQVQAMIGKLLNASEVLYGERIVYFNAPDGGAQMHHDVERGHAGVVYAQLSGQTFWLALSKPKLMDEITAFMKRADAKTQLARVLTDNDMFKTLLSLVSDRQQLSEYMENFDHELVEALVDRLPAFSEHLISVGYAHVLKPGDLILLPQRDLERSVWHSVFCLGDESGEALSFAVRPIEE